MGLKMSTKLPLVVILGSTGTGKTKLSLELAAKFAGEIVGADSMQIYNELNIASAKATKEELSSAPHHMINILEPHQTFTVVEYRNMVLPIIDNLFEKGKLPIIVGGTNYYIESILWKILVEEPGESILPEKGILPSTDYELPSQKLHEKLKQLDPVMANRLHPNNKRKILRSLEVLHLKGKKLSEILEEQCSGSKSGGGLRYDNALVFWLRCDQAVLDERLNERVDKMMQDGLLEELLNFHQAYNKGRLQDNKEPDYTKGVFQSIGFKEFHSYLMLSESEKNTELGNKLLQEGIDKLKIATRRYARKQIKWTSNRFLGRKDRQVPPIYGLDTTDVSRWAENVSKPAFHIVESYISRTKCGIEPLPMRENSVSVPNTLDQTFKCEFCDRILIGTHQWNIHLKSRRHQMGLRKLKRNRRSRDKKPVGGGKAESGNVTRGENI